jgi:hypothetical protein
MPLSGAAAWGTLQTMLPSRVGVLLGLVVAVLLAADGPGLDPVADVAVDEDSPGFSVVLTGVLPGAGASVLSIQAVSDTPGILPDPSVTGTSPIAVLGFRPVADANGRAIVTVTVQDDGGTAGGRVDSTSISFAVEIRPVNDPPGFNAVFQFFIREIDPAQPVAVSGITPGPADETAQGVSLLAFPEDDTLFTVLRIDHAPGSTTATVWIWPGIEFGSATSSRLFIVASDGASLTTKPVTIPLQGVNGRPFLSRNRVLTVAPGGSYPPSSFDIEALDPEGDQVTFQIVELPTKGHFALYDPVLGVHRNLGLHDIFTQEDILNRRLSYRNTDLLPGGDQCSVRINDGGDIPLWFQMQRYIYIDVGTGVPGPELYLYPVTTLWTEGDGPSALWTVVGLTDADSPDFAGGSITVGIVEGMQPGDVITLHNEGMGVGQVGIQGQDVLYGGIVVGTWSGGVGSPLIIALGGALATPTVAEFLLLATRFEYQGDNPTSVARTLQVVVQDGDGGTSPATLLLVQVRPDNDPPVPTTGRIAIPSGCARLVPLTAADPDSIGLSWSILTVPAGINAVMVGSDAVRVTAPPGATVTGLVSVQVSDGMFSATAGIPVVVTGVDDPRPQPGGDPPREAFAGAQVGFDVPFDCSDLGGSPVLRFAATADAPAGLLVEALDARTVRVTWPVPDSEPVSVHRRFGIIAEDPVTGSSGFLPVSVWIRPLPGGGG